MQRYNLVVNKAQITDSLEVFPASRPPVACEIMVVFDSKHTDGFKAKRMMDAPLEHALEQMSKTLMPATARTEGGDE